MWANYDYSNFPIVNVKFSKDLDSEDEFNSFLKKWTLLYQDKKDFSFILDTTNVGLIKFSYCFKMRKFIKKLKEFPHQYLQKSLIIVSNKYFKYLLNFIFSVQKPVANIYIYDIKNNETINYNSLISKIENNDLKDFTIVKCK